MKSPHRRVFSLTKRHQMRQRTQSNWYSLFGAIGFELHPDASFPVAIASLVVRAMLIDPRHVKYRHSVAETTDSVAVALVDETLHLEKKRNIR